MFCTPNFFCCTPLENSLRSDESAALNAACAGFVNFHPNFSNFPMDKLAGSTRRLKQDKIIEGK